MSQTPPDRMSPTEIVAEIGELQKELSFRFLRIQLLSKGLYGSVRRATPNANTPIYLRYANTWMQFSGMANQGLKRSASISRVLGSLETEAPQTAPKPQPKPPKETPLSPVEQLLKSYAEEPEDKKPYRALYDRQPAITQQERFASQAATEDDEDGEDLSAFDEDLDGN